MRASVRSALLALVLGACGGGPSGTADAGPPREVSGDDDARGPEDCPGTTCFAGEVLHDCVCVPEPRQEAVRTTCAAISSADTTRNPDDDFCVDAAEGGPPDLSCFTTSRRAPLTSRMVTVYGVVDVFGNGPDSGTVTVEIYREGADGALGAMIGSAPAQTGGPCAETEIEIENMEPTGEVRNLGFYTIENVPSETPLIVVTRPSAGAEAVWKSLYTYNFVVLDEEIEPASPACSALPGALFHEYRARVLASTDYRTIPRTAGLSAGIPSGHGAIAGEVHDCANVRVAYARVALDPAAEAFTYFTDDADNPLPDVSRIVGTSQLGLYSGLDLPVGPIQVSAIGMVDGQLVSLGWYRAQIFADSVTSVSLRGLRPHQTQ